jgi:hypothetical protein
VLQHAAAAPGAGMPVGGMPGGAVGGPAEQGAGLVANPAVGRQSQMGTRGSTMGTLGLGGANPYRQGAARRTDLVGGVQTGLPAERPKPRMSQRQIAAVSGMGTLGAGTGGGIGGSRALQNLRRGSKNMGQESQSLRGAGRASIRGSQMLGGAARPANHAQRRLSQLTANRQAREQAALATATAANERLPVLSIPALGGNLGGAGGLGTGGAGGRQSVLGGAGGLGRTTRGGRQSVLAGTDRRRQKGDHSAIELSMMLTRQR